MQVIELPIDMSGEDALVLVRVLERIIAAIWDAHGREMSDILESMADAQQAELPF